MIRAIKLRLDDFGRSAVEYYAKTQGKDQGEFVRRALLHYLSEVQSNRAAAAFPKLRRPARFPPKSDKADTLELFVDLEAAEWEALVGHAAREGVAVEAILGHAVMLYVADLDVPPREPAAGDE